MKIKNKLCCLFIILALLFSVILCSCEKEEDDSVLLNKANELIHKMETFNIVYYIEGIPITTSEAVNGYYLADLDLFQSKGFTSLEASKEYIKEFLSTSLYNSIINSSLFKPIYSDNKIYSYAYCYEEYDDNGQLQSIHVSATGLPIPCDSVEYLYDTLRITGKTSKAAELQIDCIVTNQDNQTQNRTLQVKLVNEGDKWVLNTYTCIKYSKYN